MMSVLAVSSDSNPVRVRRSGRYEVRDEIYDGSQIINKFPGPPFFFIFHYSRHSADGNTFPAKTAGIVTLSALRA